MKKALRPIFWAETSLAILTTILFVVTLVWRDWIELIFKVDPDNLNGGIELLIVGALLVITLVLFSLASFEWRRARVTTA